MTTKLERRLQAFDGVAVSLLSEARAACRETADYFNDLLVLCFDKRPNISIGGTWILKAELAEGAILSPALTDRLVGSLDELKAWQAILHVCQIADRLDLTSEQAGRMIEWGRGLKDHRRPFLRAWSLHMRVVLGQAFPGYQHEVASALAAAENDEAASVRARAGQLQREVAR